MSKFEQHIRDYYRERLGVEFHTSDYGFVGYRIQGTDLYINEWYATPDRGFYEALSLILAVKKIGKERGCIRLIGCNETTLATYDDIRKLHIWFKMVKIGNNGTSELWARMI